MKASDRVKRGALEKTFNYFLKDPEHNIVKIMDLLEKSNTRQSICQPTEIFS